MSIDLKAFEEAVEAARTEIAAIQISSSLTLEESRLARIAEWMLVQLDSLTKKVAELERPRT